MNLFGKKCLVVIDSALSCGMVIEEHRYNVVMKIEEYDRPQVVEKGNVVTAFNESAVSELKKG